MHSALLWSTYDKLDVRHSKGSFESAGDPVAPHATSMIL